MPTLTEAARREATRLLALSRKRGDYITAGGGPVMVVDGRPMTMRPLESDAERKAREKRAWEKEFERKFLSGW